MSTEYEIRVIRERGNCTDHLFTYTGATHPVCSDSVEFECESFLVNAVRHVLKLSFDGYSLDYVEVKVY